MRYDRATYEAVKKWKTRLAIAAVAVLGFGLVGCGAGAYGIYSVGKQISQSVGEVDLTGVLPDVKALELGPLADTTLSVMGAWAAASMEGGDAQAVRSGLACIDALGGPDARKLLATLSGLAGSEATAESMRKLAESIPVGQKNAGVASCMYFMAG